MANEKLQALHKATSEKYNLGDFDTFASKMQDEEKRGLFYKQASQDFDLGTLEEFNQKVGGDIGAGKLAVESLKQGTGEAIKTAAAAPVRSIPSTLATLGMIGGPSSVAGYITPSVVGITAQQKERELMMQSPELEKLYNITSKAAQGIEAAIDPFVPKGAIPSKYQTPPERISEYLTDPKRAISTLRYVPQMAGFMVATAINPTFGAATMYMAESNDAAKAIEEYEMETGETVPMEMKTIGVATVSTFNAVLEKTGLDNILAKSGVKGIRGILLKALTGMITEGSTEGLQEVNQVLLEQGYSSEAFDWKRIGEAIYGGAIMGLGGGSVKGTIDTIFDKDKPGVMIDETVTIRFSGYQYVSGEGIITEESFTGEKAPWQMTEEEFIEARPHVPGYSYHGSPEGDIKNIDPYRHTKNWREGLGFYTTEDIKVAEGYAKGRTAKGDKKVSAKESGRINYIKGKPKNILNMDAHLDKSIWNTVATHMGYEGSFDFEEATTNGQAYKEIIQDYNAENMTGEGQYYIEEILTTMGFDATQHTEGVQSGKPHIVTIWKSDVNPPQVVSPEDVYREVIVKAEREGKIIGKPTPTSKVIKGSSIRIPQYNVTDSRGEHDLHKSTVTAAELEAAGLPIPAQVRSSELVNNSIIHRIGELAEGGREGPRSMEEIARDEELDKLFHERDAAEESIESRDTKEGISIYTYKAPDISENRKDISTLKAIFLDPEFAFGKIGAVEAEALATKIVEGDLKLTHTMSNHNEFFHKLKQGLSKKDQKLVRKAIERIYDLRRGNSIGNEVKLGKIAETKIGKAALGAITWFEATRDRIKAYKREQIREKMPASLNAALDEWIATPIIEGAGYDAIIADIAAKHGIAVKELQTLVDGFKAIDNWGIDEYVTKMERGNYKVYETIGKEEHVVAVRETRAAAQKEMKDRQRMSPGGSFDVRLEMSEENPLKKTTFRLKGMENIFDILPTYAYRVERLLALAPIKAEMTREFAIDDKRKVPDRIYKPRTRETLRKQIGAASNRYSTGDKLFNELLESRFGKRFLTHTKPFGYARSIGRARSITAALKLGYRVNAAFINKVCGEMHMSATMGADWLHKGAKFLRTEKGKKLIAENEWLLGMDFALERTGKAHTRLHPLHPLKLFALPEPGMRKRGLAAAYLKAMDSGMTHEEALSDAGKYVRYALFSYNTSSLPLIMRGPTGKLLFQFKPYLVKELEFISSLAPDQMARYIGMQMLFSGPRGFMHFLKTIPILGMAGVLDDLERWMEQQKLPEDIPVVGGKNPAYGLFGAVTGADVTQAATVQLADKPEDMFGPTILEAIQLYKDVGQQFFHNMLTKEERNKYILMGDRLKRWTINTSAYAPKFMELVDALVSEDDWVQDRDGNPLYKISGPWDKVMLLAGAYPIERTSKQTLLRTFKKEDKVRMDNIRHFNSMLTKKIMREKPFVKLTDIMLTKLRKNEDIPEELTSAIADYVVKSYEISEKDIDTMILLGMLNPGATINRLAERASMSPEDRYIMQANILQKARAAGILDLGSE